MRATSWHWLVTNIGTLLIALLLAMVVWVSAVISADPNEVHVLPRLVPIEYIGQDPNLQIMGNPQTQVRLTLNAPKSVWTELTTNEEAVRAWVDLSNRGSGEYTIPVQVQINLDLVRLVQQEPQTLTLNLESLISREFPVTVVVSGDPPTGYQMGPAQTDPAQVTVSGPESIVGRVREVRVALDVSGATQTVTKTLSPEALDAAGRLVPGVSISPDLLTVIEPISLLGGFRYVIVKAVTVGQVANGYKLTNIYVTPAGVVVFSSDPQLVNELPGYVETQPVDLTDADDDFEVLVDLNVPEGISIVGDPKVLVQVSIAAIETNLAVSLPVDVTGLTPGLEAQVSPATVDVILAGPVPILDVLQPSDIRVKVDLTGYEPGIYQLIPIVDFLPERVRIVSLLPNTVEVTITQAPTPTITPTVGLTLTPSPTPQP